MGLFEELEWRGQVQDRTEGVADLLDRGPARVYIGFDPSADSLHVGSLVPLITLARAQRAGHQAVAVVGGGTGMIGDPSGKSKERNLLGAEDLQRNVAAIRAQIAGILASAGGGEPAVLVDNLEWLATFRMIDFLRDVGKHFSVNAMIAKESVKRRLAAEQGISYTEFSYLVLQAYDYYELFRRHGVRLQFGGSDQWGNITAGIDFVRAMTGERVHGLTFPLVTSASGVKFGKTEEGAVWLDPRRTSPYRFYQFWLNVEDRDVVAYLKTFTFLDRAEIEALAAAQAAAPAERLAQRRLAGEVTRLVHGAGALARAERATEVFFGGELQDLLLEDVLEVFADVPSTALPADRFAGGAPLADVLVDAGVVPSKKEARRSIESGGIYVNNRRVADVASRLERADAIGGRVFVLRKGRKSYHLVRVAGDAPP